MKILWLCNVAIPIIAKEITQNTAVSGGWIDSAITPFIKVKDFEIVYLFPNNDSIVGNVNNIKYYGFNLKQNLYQLKKMFEEVLKCEAPDVVHVWGTEYLHSLAMVQACKANQILNRTIVSIQGLVSAIVPVYFQGLDKKAIYSKTIRDIIKRDNIRNQKNNFELRAVNEQKVLKMVKNVIGRTKWDKKMCLSFNDKINYYFCNENLRQPFYNAKQWDYKTCDVHRIFFAQANYPVKGFHFAIEALSDLKKVYPDIKLVVTGFDFMKTSFLEMQRKTYYYSYLRKLASRLGVAKNIEVVGQLNAQEMVKQYQKSHIFLSCSTIENSSNAICEAMMIGTPVVASNVGGTPTLLEDGNVGEMFDIENKESLVVAIKKIFENNKINELSKRETICAKLRHDINTNTQQLLNIYKTICL